MAPKPRTICRSSSCEKKTMLIKMARIGIVLPNGILNERLMSFLVLRKTMTARHVGMYCVKRTTALMAASVVNDPVVLTAIAASPDTMMHQYGAPNRLCWAMTAWQHAFFSKRKSVSRHHKGSHDADAADRLIG